MRKLKSILTDMDLTCKLLQAKSDEDFGKLGFECFGHMSEAKEFYMNSVPYRAWLWYKHINDSQTYIIIVHDEGNSNSHMILNDVQVEAILNPVVVEDNPELPGDMIA